MQQESTYQTKLETLAEKIREAEAIMVGTGSAMQKASGLRFYRECDDVFQDNFGPWARKYGFRSAEEALNFNYGSSEDRWAMLATHSHLIESLPVSQVYLDLQALLEGKSFHIVTLNHDGQLQKVFGEDRVSIIQGDYRYWQCFRRCHDKVYPCTDELEQIYQHVEGHSIPSEFVPRCPECGAEMEPWVGGYAFLEGEQYKAEYGKWEDFVLSCQQSKTLFLEIGVSRKRKELIRQPMWHFAMGWPDGFYVNISPDNSMIPRELDGRSLEIEHSIVEVLRDVRQLV